MGDHQIYAEEIRSLQEEGAYAEEERSSQITDSQVSCLDYLARCWRGEAIYMDPRAPTLKVLERHGLIKAVLHPRSDLPGDWWVPTKAGLAYLQTLTKVQA